MVNVSKLSQKKRRALQKKRICRFCADASLAIDYKDTKLLSQFTTERGKIIPRRISGNCAKHQRELTLSVKRARHIALLAYTSSTLSG